MHGMARRVMSLAALALSGTIWARSTPLDAVFWGRWTEAESKTHCSTVRGFLLRADGTAQVDWAMGNFANVEHRDGAWTARATELHVSLPLHIAVTLDADKTETFSMEITFDGVLDGSGDQVHGRVS